jgi:hypothetical protein
LQDFSKAIHPISFFVYVHAFVSSYVEWPAICLDNGQTNERLVVKTIDPPSLFHLYPVLISRYPAGANQAWIDANENEIMEWKFHEQNRRIRFDYSLGWTV